MLVVGRVLSSGHQFGGNSSRWWHCKDSLCNLNALGWMDLALDVVTLVTVDKDLEIRGLIEPILGPKAVDSYPHCQEIQQWGGGALRHLAIEIGDNRREVLQDGEVQLTMSRG